MTDSVGQAPGSRMLAAFLGHGNPTNALDRNRYMEAMTFAPFVLESGVETG